MATFGTILAVFLKCRSGATAIEYGLISAGIAVVVVSTLKNIGTNLNTVLTKVAANLK